MWLLDSLASGRMFLVPYDCGHNHGPALHGGKKAHWAEVEELLENQEEIPLDMAELDPHTEEYIGGYISKKV